MLGPAFVAAVAYVDPGNFATNIQGGARFGYLLLWVVLAANLMAMLIQYLSAKLGIVTDRNLPELCRDHYPRPVAWGLWIQAEAMAMATDVAEFIGAALGLNLLFGVPLLPAGLITGVIAFALLELQRHGFRRFELAITALARADPARLPLRDAEDRPVGGRRRARARPAPRRRRVGLSRGRDHRRDRHAARDLSPLGADEGTDAGAQRGRAEAGAPLRAHRRDRGARSRRAREHGDARVAAKLFHGTPGYSHVDTIEGAHAGFSHLVGGTAALAFAVALFASGISSSSVGTYAGQVVMAGFVNLRISLFVRRGADDDPGARRARRRRQPDERARPEPGRALVRDPVRSRPAAAPDETPRRDGRPRQPAPTTVVAGAIAALISALNVFLLAQAIGLG